MQNDKQSQTSLSKPSSDMSASHTETLKSPTFQSESSQTSQLKQNDIDNSVNNTLNSSINNSLDKSPQNRGLNSINQNSNHNVSQYGSLDTLGEKTEKDLVRFNHISYLLYVLSFFTAGILWIVPIIMNYARRTEANNSWLATHFDWQIKTFWYSIIFSGLAVILILVATGGLGLGLVAQSGSWAVGSAAMAVFGILLLVGVVVWHIYRIVKGWIALSNNQPVQ